MSDDTRGGRYSREARFFFSGDKAAAQSHVLDARSLLGYMRDMQTLGGPPIQTQHVQLQDGTQIKAVLMNGQYQASIYTPTTKPVEQITTCVPFWSGLINVAYPSWHSDFYPSPYQLLTTPNLLDEQSAPIPLPGRLPIPDRKPGMFSGEMRIVVQLLEGMENPGSDTFTYTFSGTTGLVRVPAAPGEAPTTDFWLVKFPAYGYGILAMKYPVCTSLTEEQIAAGLEYVPIPRPNMGIPGPEGLPAAIAAGDVIEVMSLNDYERVVGATGFYAPFTECGWAFSKSGHEAQNVLYGFEPVAPYVHSYRFKFYFTATRDTITCTGSQVQTGAVTTAIIGVCPRFPNGSVLNSLTALFKTGTQYTGNMPLYAYYDGDDEQVWSLDVTWNDGLTNETTYGYGYCPSEFYSINWDNGFYTYQYKLNGEVKFGARETSYVKINDRMYSGPPSSGGGNYIDVPGVYGMGNMSQVLYNMTVWHEEWTEHVTGAMEYGTMYVPIGQREGVYTLQHERIEYPTVNHNHYYEGTPISGELWPYSGGVVQWERYDPNYHNNILHCPSTDVMYTLIISSASTIPWDGHSDAVPASAGGIVAPSPNGFTVVVAEPEVNLSYLKYWGGGETVVAQNLAQGALDAWFAPAGGGVEDQWIYAYMDAMNNTKHILSQKINPHDATDYTTNTTYPVSGMPGTGFHFVGIAVDQPIEEA